MNKTDLIQKVKALDGLSQDERAYLINLVNTKKKYGLVWEDKPEEVEEQLRENLPVLKEVKEKAIVNGEDYPNHILIEGDNLHALTALSFTHEGRIDVIYIDPPYNTGNKDFKYNDSFVDKEDSYRHSKWLGFMNKRLISYAKNYDNTDFSLLPRTEKMDKRYKNIDNDPRGPWKPGDLVANEERKNGHYIITGPHGDKFDSPPGKHWSYAQDKMILLQKDNRLFFGKNGKSIPSIKQFLSEVQQGRKASTLFLHDEAGHNDEAKKELKDFFEQSDDLFSTPKPTRLIKQLLRLVIVKNPIVLDFFAGSGTTMQATIDLNNEDGFKRQCILITNNENKICEEVTYERNKKVIQGYTNSKSEKVEGLSYNNLRYYKSEFVSREPSLKNKRELTQLATELLCIKEDCYTEQKIKIKQAKLFANARVTLLILFDDHIIPDAVELIKGMDAKEIKVYVFSMGSDPYTEDFAEVLDKVTLCALPDAIYKAYQNVLPKKKRTVPLMEEGSETPTNENGEQISIL